MEAILGFTLIICKDCGKTVYSSSTNTDACHRCLHPQEGEIKEWKIDVRKAGTSHQ